MRTIVMMLTFCVPEKVEDSGFQKSLRVSVYCYMKLNAIDHSNLNPLKRQRPEMRLFFYYLFPLQ